MFEDIWQLATGVPLLICSIVALSLIIERTLFLAKQKDLPQNKYESALTHIANARPEEATQEILQSKPFYAQALELMKAESLSEKFVRDEHVSTLMILFNSRLRQRLSGLVTIAALAPMLGLLGTIIGLMRAFRNIGEHVGPVEPSLVANGLWQALSTTAAGMVIAVICILTHAIFLSKIKRMLTRSQFILNSLSQAMQQKNRQAESVNDSV